MAYIYLVNARTDYEGHWTICAFANEKLAEALAAKCRHLDTLQPKAPAIDASDALWAIFDEKNGRWQKKHPAGRAYDGYDVARVKLK